jgi:hypothetical protein
MAPHLRKKFLLYHEPLFMLREGTLLREYVCEENNQDAGRTRELLKDASPVGK